MTDPRRPDDELVSAVLDGEASADERARVEGDPTLRARLAEFRSISEAVRAPAGPVDAAARDDAIARAVAANTHEGQEARVVGLDAERARRRPELTRRLMIGAAAVVAVLALAGGLLTLGDDGESATDQAATLESDDATAEAGDAAVPELDLGEIDDPDALAAAVVDQSGLTVSRDGGGVEDAPEAAVPESGEALAEPDTEAPGEGEGGAEVESSGESRTAEDCAIELIESRPFLIGQLTQGTVTYQGTEAYVFVYNDARTNSPLTLVTARKDCKVLEEVPL